MMIVNVLKLLAGGGLLWFGAGWIVDSAAAVARKFKISELVIGLTVVAMGTSAPEFLVTLMAAIKGLAEISLANVVGSNIFNLGIILGLMSLINPVPAEGRSLNRYCLLLLLLTGLLLLLCRDLSLSRTDGLILSLVFGAYLAYLVYSAVKASRLASSLEKFAVQGEGTAGTDQPLEREARGADYIKLVIGFAAISFGSNLLVDSASAIALALGVSEWAIGLTIVASGTSLPELVTCLAASVRGKSDMLLGNLIGSDFFNLAGVLGLTCLIRPLQVSGTAMPGLILLVAGVFTVTAFVFTGKRINRIEGAFLIGLSLFHWSLEFF